MKEKKIIKLFEKSKLFRNVKFNYLVLTGKYDQLGKDANPNFEEFLAEPSKFLVNEDDIIYDELKKVVEEGAETTNEKVIEAAKIFFDAKKKEEAKEAKKANKKALKENKEQSKESEKNQKKIEKNAKNILKSFDKSPQYSNEVKTVINDNSDNILTKISMTEAAISGARMVSYVSKYITDIDTNIIENLSRNEKEICNAISEELNFGKMYPEVSTSTISAFDVRSNLFKKESDFIIDSEDIKAKLSNPDFVRKVNEKKEFLSLHPEDDKPDEEEKPTYESESKKRLTYPFLFMDKDKYYMDMSTGEWKERIPVEDPPKKDDASSSNNLEIDPKKIYSLEELRTLVLGSAELQSVIGDKIEEDQVLIHPQGWVFVNIKHPEGIEHYRFDVNMIPGRLSMMIPLTERERMISLNGVKLKADYVSVAIDEPIVKTAIDTHDYKINIADVPQNAAALWENDYEAIMADQQRIIQEQQMINQIKNPMMAQQQAIQQQQMNSYMTQPQGQMMGQQMPIMDPFAIPPQMLANMQQQQPSQIIRGEEPIIISKTAEEPYNDEVKITMNTETENPTPVAPATGGTPNPVFKLFPHLLNDPELNPELVNS